MGREISTMDDEFELSLELSIGGCYGKSENPKIVEGKIRDSSEEHLSRSDFSCGKIDVEAENGSEIVDLQKRREIRALRRREARMKREVKKSRGLNNGGFVEDKLIVEAQQFQTRVQDRETREKDEISEDSDRKKVESGRKKAVGDLNISLFTETKISGADFASQKMQTQFLFPQVQYLPIRNGYSLPWVVPLWESHVVAGERKEKNVFRPVANGNGNGNGSRNSSIHDCDSGNEPEDREAISNRFVERSSSVVSDHRSASQKGGSSSDTGSHSSSFGTHQNLCVSRSDRIEHLKIIQSPPQTETGQCVGKLNREQSMKMDPSSIQQLKSSTREMIGRSKIHTQASQACSTTEKPYSPPLKETSDLINRPPKPPNQNQNNASVEHMPCVSTTGNGPNGKTIKGFLSKYTKSEVSIICVCHGSTFSPAEFVEHAGGIDISHPLKHITIVPSTS